MKGTTLAARALKLYRGREQQIRASGSEEISQIDDQSTNPGGGDPGSLSEGESGNKGNEPDSATFEEASDELHREDLPQHLKEIGNGLVWIDYQKARDRVPPTVGWS